MDRIALKSGLWLMVADGEKALFLKNEGDTTYPNFEVVRDIGQAKSRRRSPTTPCSISRNFCSPPDPRLGAIPGKVRSGIAAKQGVRSVQRFH